MPHCQLTKHSTEMDTHIAGECFVKDGRDEAAVDNSVVTAERSSEMNHSCSTVSRNMLHEGNRQPTDCLGLVLLGEDNWWDCKPSWSSERTGGE
jgi:hypothetical protein